MMELDTHSSTVCRHKYGSRLKFIDRDDDITTLTQRWLAERLPLSKCWNHWGNIC